MMKAGADPRDHFLRQETGGPRRLVRCDAVCNPVQKRSGKSIKLNCDEVQSTNSSLKRDKCISRILAKLLNSIAKSRSLTESKEFSVGASKPNSCAV